MINVYDLNGDTVETIGLPKVFDTPLRPDMIKRAVLAQQSHNRQPQGRDRMAGKRTTAESMGTGYGIARMARVKGSGYPKARQAAFIPSAVGGRRTHPPVANKKIRQKINKKERQLAIRSAIAATAHQDLVAARGHIIDKIPSFPMVISDDLHKISTAKELREIFTKVGVTDDISRVKNSVKIRAGKGTMRGRKRRHGRGPLIVIHEDEGITRGAENFLGVDVARVTDLNVEQLAPGTSLGRLTLWTVSAFKELDTQFPQE
jgi:large subunit ribosomal protein L4e